MNSSAKVNKATRYATRRVARILGVRLKAARARPLDLRKSRRKWWGECFVEERIVDIFTSWIDRHGKAEPCSASDIIDTIAHEVSHFIHPGHGVAHKELRDALRPAARRFFYESLLGAA